MIADDDANDFQRDFERLEAKLTAPKDQTFAEFREEYIRLGPADQQAFRIWVEQLASVRRVSGIPLHASAQVKVSIPEGEQDRTIVAPPPILLEAIKMWDQGKEFLPGLVDL